MSSNVGHSSPWDACSARGELSRAFMTETRKDDAPEVVAPSSGRQQLLKARQLLISHNRTGAQEAYTLALRQAQLPRPDLAACFLCHLRLAQLSFVAGDDSSGESSPATAVARAHLESALLAIPPHATSGALSIYFRTVASKLAGLNEASRRHREDGGDDSRRLAAVSRSLEELGLPGDVGDRKTKDSRPRMEARATITAKGVELVRGRRAEVKIDVSCNGCGKSKSGATAEAADDEAQDQGGGWYCLDCTAAYHKAVAQGPKSDGTPCAGCEDRTQPVAIEPDGKWYCEACVQEFYEEGEVGK